jgi:hypothetical protein
VSGFAARRPQDRCSASMTRRSLAGTSNCSAGRRNRRRVS